MPTLILTGEFDHPDVHAHSGAIEAGVATAHRVVLSGSGHSPQVEVPHTLTETLREFLTRT